jgi:DUF1365 family protein
VNSKLYFGKVSHTRTQPLNHRFEYQTFMCFLDIDELDSVFACHGFWSHAKRNLAWFNHANYIGRDSDIRSAVQHHITEQTGDNFTGRICILTHLTYFGCCFNPVSFYYCYNDQDQLSYILSEINNTPWDERHVYVTKVTDEKPMIIDSFDKNFHVSPFLDMDFRYKWQFSHPQDDIIINMDNFKQGQHWFNAYMELEAEPISHRSLSKALRQYPFMTLKVVLAIYWQALKLKLKGAKFYDHPNPESMRTSD